MVIGSCAPTGVYHTVKPDQTLYRIAKTYNIDEKALAEINNINDPTKLKVNQRIYIPGVTQLKEVPVNTSAHVKPTTKPTNDKTFKPGTNKPNSSAPLPGNDSILTKPTKGVFIWPVQGKLVNRFGKHGQKVFKGIEIAVPKGTGVVAAAAGKVIYSGNAIPGFGNLIVLEHSENFFSVYGFNSKNLVKRDDFVGQGEKIALSGLPPSGQSARLHFEIRKGKSAVDPILFLP